MAFELPMILAIDGIYNFIKNRVFQMKKYEISNLVQLPTLNVYLVSTI